MNLRDLIGTYPILDYKGSLDIDIKGLSNHSKKVSQGHIFFAQKGFKLDGHDFIDEAIENGARCILYQDPDIRPRPGISYLRVKDSVDAISYVANKFYQRPWSKINMIGITGTNGKTSTSHFIKNILDYSGREAGLIGTLGLTIGQSKSPLINTTPDILVILESLNKMLDKKLDSCIMEVSSHSLALDRVKGIEFDLGIFTNLTKDHLDYHRDMDHYFNSKLKLMEITRKYCIINLDDFYGPKIIEKLPQKNYVTYGIDNYADAKAEDIMYNMNGVNYTLVYRDQRIPIEINIPGRFSVYNSLAAIATCLALNIPIDNMVKALKDFKSVKGRFELLDIDRNFNVIIDFAHTPDGLYNVLSSIKEFARGRIIVVFGAGGDRDRTKRSIMGEVVGQFADYAIVTSDNPRTESPEKIIEDILVGIYRSGVNHKAIVDRKEAIKHAIDIADDNDIILLAGKGHEEYMIIGDTTIEFKEREIIKGLLENNNSQERRQK